MKIYILFATAFAIMINSDLLANRDFETKELEHEFFGLKLCNEPIADLLADLKRETRMNKVDNTSMPEISDTINSLMAVCISKLDEINSGRDASGTKAVKMLELLARANSYSLSLFREPDLKWQNGENVNKIKARLFAIDLKSYPIFEDYLKAEDLMKADLHSSDKVINSASIIIELHKIVKLENHRIMHSGNSENDKVDALLDLAARYHLATEKLIEKPVGDKKASDLNSKKMKLHLSNGTPDV